jgi:hypothetical protein
MHRIDFDLGKYWGLFPKALLDGYGRRFELDESDLVFANIGRTFAGSDRDLTIDHVKAIFSKDLPFADDWTTPDFGVLGKRMTERNVADSIRLLGGDVDNLKLIGKILYCFRELGLTSLVLHHVYPKHFAMCSHHLASLLYITAPTVPEYYVKYCKELREWSTREWSTRAPRIQGSAVKTEFALWTWYRLAYHGELGERDEHYRAFFTDSWIQEQRAWQIAESLKEIRPLDLAWAFLDSQPTVAAMIACREFETVAREVVRLRGEVVPYKMVHVVKRLVSDIRDQNYFLSLLALRDRVIHRGYMIKKEEARKVLRGFGKFIEDHAPHSSAAKRVQSAMAAKVSV